MGTREKGRKTRNPSPASTSFRELNALVDSLRTRWDALEGSPLEGKSLARLCGAARRLARRLSGAGLDAAEGHARRLETALEEAIGAEGESATGIRAHVWELLSALETSLSGAPPDTPAGFVPVRADAEAEAEKEVQHVFLADLDPARAEDLAAQIRTFGYHVSVFAGPGAMAGEIGRRPPGAVVLAAEFALGRDEYGPAMNRLREACGGRSPLVFFSSQGDVASRLTAIRAGGSAFFTRPVDVGALVEKLDSLTSHWPQEPYRILVVVQDEAQASRLAGHLGEAGMTTSVVDRLFDLMGRLSDFGPDLILMDTALEGCSGLELAGAIRQQEWYVGIPILFLGPQREGSRESGAAIAGHDFLAKPVDPAILIPAVRTRVERFRVLRSFMVRDSLTGLLNHTTTKEHLALEVARARRTGSEVAYAMIDLDHFKAINDAFGHAVGDRILKSLARLLVQRMRRTDLIGRYGGEEFAVILPDSDLFSAVRILEGIRKGFSHIRHRGGDTEFATTFSCGIAGFPDFREVAALGEAADRALYEAKRRGRNRVEVALPR